ncbi:MAG: IclR family transcriptional regulator [Litorimonas sp.]
MEAKYKAPALVKGLEIIELLAPQSDPLTLSEICTALDRSKSEIFRMVQELDRTGYIEKPEGHDGFRVTRKLFTLGMERPRVSTLLEVALPEMRKFSQLTHQSCHIAIHSGDDIVVIARMESPGPVTFSVRIGHRQLLARSSSGVVIYTWCLEDTQKEMLTRIKASDRNFDKAKFLQLSETTLKNGYMRKQSRFIDGVTDISAPIMRGGQTTASLTAPCISEIGTLATLPVAELIETTKRISDQLSQ